MAHAPQPDPPNDTGDRDLRHSAFGQLVLDALTRLYDVPYLQTHPLTGRLASEPGRRASSQGQSLQRVLLDAITALRSEGPTTTSQTTLSQRILTLRYGEALAVAEVCRRLDISRSTYYQAHRHGLTAVVSLLWERRNESERPAKSVGQSASALRALPLPAVPSLPRSLTRFIGRARELADVVDRLTREPEACRLLTLTGTGGCGKTRLAIEVGAEMLVGCLDGVWLVELAALTEAGLVAPAVAAAMGIREETGQPMQVSLQRALRSRQLLLVLDNCEHLLDACARLADALLGSCPGVRILATSREALGIPGEVVWRVPSLATPPADAPAEPTSLERYPAIQLFVERAAAAAPDFALSVRNAAAVAEICRRLDGIPLAIELAAGRVPALALEQIAARLDRRFRLLTGGSRAALPRQQTLQAAVAWSYDLLTPAERILFARLAVFAGGFTLDAAEAVGEIETKSTLDFAASPASRESLEGVNKGEVMDLLTRLVAKSLVTIEARGARYGLLETLRQFGRERLLASGASETVYQRHASYFLALAEQSSAGGGLHHHLSVDALNRLDAEHDNFRQALAWCAEQRDDVAAAEMGLRLASSLLALWYGRGYFAEGRAWLASAMTAAGPAPTVHRARALHGVHLLAAKVGDYATADRLAEEALSVARAIADSEAIAMGLSAMGQIALCRHADVERAEALYTEARDRFEELGDTLSLGPLMIHLGHAALYRRDFPEARRRVEAGLALLQPADRVIRGHFALYVLGDIAFFQGDVERAERLFAEALVEGRARGDQDATGRMLTSLGRVAQVRGDLGEAEALYLEAMEPYRQIDYLEGIADVFHRLSQVAAARAQPKRAARLMGAASVLPFTVGSLEPHFEHATYDHCVGLVRATLGETVFAAAFASGRALSLDEAIAQERTDADADTPDAIRC